VIFHIRFVLRRRAEPKLFGDKPVLLVKRTGIHIGLQRIQPEVVWRKLAGVLQERFANSPILIVRVDI
jgi:hypothetical protein